MRAINIVLAVLTSVLFGALMFEGGLRLIGRGPERTMLDFDPQLGWSKKPGTSFTRKTSEFKVTYDINEHGLRDDPMPDPAKPAGTFRVVMLGDSFTQGWPVSRDELFVDHLERWWQEEGRKVDVVNAGTEGYSTDQAVAWFLHNANTFQPDAAVLFAYENDLYWNSQKEYVGGRHKPRFEPDGSLEPRTLVNTKEPALSDSWAIARLFKSGAKAPTEHMFTPPGGKRPILKEWAAVLHETPDFFEDSIARTRGALTAFQRKCKELGVLGIVVPLPSHSAVDPEFRSKFGAGALALPDEAWSPDKPVDTFLTLANEAGLASLDPRPALKEAGGGELFFKRDWHMNAAGNAALAEFLHGELDKMGVFGPSHAATAQVAMPTPPAEAGLPFPLVLYLGLLALLSTLYMVSYPDEPKWQPPVKVALLLAAVFGIVIGGGKLLDLVPPQFSMALLLLFVAVVVGFILYKLGHRLGTIAELIRSFVLRGHWYLMPLVVVLLTIGSLLVVAASSPLVAPFIYTLF